LIVLLLLCFNHNSFAVGQLRYVQSVPDNGSFPIVRGNKAAAIYVDSSDWPGVIRAAKDLQSDIARVTDRAAMIYSEADRLGGEAIIIGTIGKSRIVDGLAKAGKIDLRQIAGKWESFFLQVVPNPLPNVASALAIVGSDKRGTIYGIYDLSEQLGVSPWYWWADVPAQHKDAIFVKPGKHAQGPPSVKYRGIFLARRKPELLEPSTYSLIDYQEAERVVADFQTIRVKAEEIYKQLPQKSRDAFYDLVLFPTAACAQVNELYVAAAKNALYARQGRAGTNDMADRVQQLFNADAGLMHYYNNDFAGGKWKHLMDQVHIGYTIWQDPKQNVMPRITKIEVPQAAGLGVAVEGSSSSWPGTSGEPALLSFDAFGQQRRYIDIFNRGQQPFAYIVNASEPWILLSKSRGTITKEERIWISVDWNKVPKAVSNGAVKIIRTGGEGVDVKIALNHRASATRNLPAGFVEGDGYISIEAEHYTANIPSKQARWEKIEGYGRTLSAMTIMPMTAPSAAPPSDSPRLEYGIYLFKTGKLAVLATVAPTLNFVPGRGLRYAVSFDDEPPQTIEIVPKDFDARNGNREWEDSVRNAARLVRSTHTLSSAGYHTLKIWMVDPAVVLEKIVVDLGGQRPSYLGPPKSARIRVH